MSGRTPDIDLDEPQSPPGADCCTSGHSLTDTEISGDVQLLSTLGSSTRYEPLRIIAGSDRGACGCELEPLLDVSQGAVSQALSRLHKAGLVDRRKTGDGDTIQRPHEQPSSYVSSMKRGMTKTVEFPTGN